MFGRLTAYSENVSYGRLAFGSLALLLLWRVMALGLNNTDLFFDEAQYWSWSESLDAGYFSKPPLLAWLIRGFTESCGEGVFCIRLASPVIHTITASLVYLIALQLYNARVGFWSAIVFATLPGISLSAGLISTDVPLLACWAAALVCFARLRKLDHEPSGQSNNSGIWAVALGVAVGAGFMAKYAMVYFVLCMVLFAIIERNRMALPRARSLAIAGIIAVVIVLPNIWWNIDNGFVTFSHTAANAKWGGSLFHPVKALEFFGAQFGVFGPILFGALIVLSAHVVRRQPFSETDRLLLAFSVPVIVLITGQAFLSRAHANWAAVAYVAATPLVVGTMLRQGHKTLLVASTVFHIALVGVITFGNYRAGAFVLPGQARPYARVLGWQEAALEVSGVLDEARSAGQPYSAILTNGRATAAEFSYYLRHRPEPVLAWKPIGKPNDHYQMTQPFSHNVKGRVLLITRKPSVPGIVKNFSGSTALPQLAVTTSPDRKRVFYLYSLSDYRPQ